MNRVRWSVVVAVMFLATLIRPVHAQASSLADQVRGLAQRAEAGIAAANTTNGDQSRAEYQAIHALWETFEDQVRTADPTGYMELETSLAAIANAVQMQPIDRAAVRTAYSGLKDVAINVADRIGAGTTAPPPATDATPADLLQILDTAYQAVAQGDVASATTSMHTARRLWPGVEGVIAVKSQADYTAIESDLAGAIAALNAQPVNAEAAEAAIGRLRTTLAPYTARQAYTAFDAAAIILREGLEALLVMVALLAFLRRSGNADKRGWVWAGGALGILASVVIAFVLQNIFSRVSAGHNQEVIEGATGLLAAALLFYVSYWMHSKASLHAWRAYIDTRTTQALARGNLIGLALLAFFAVFREGGETTIFYLGMAPAIAARDLVLGLAIGVAVLLVAAVLMVIAGVKLPLRPFFRVAGLLVYYLGFKFVGTGIHALQVANVLPASPIPGMLAIPFFGVFPTWETLLPQAVLILGAFGVWRYLHIRDQRLTIGGAVA